MELGRGIIITIGGMGLVFFSLAILLMAIVILNRLFKPEGANPGSALLAVAGEIQEDPECDPEVVAAVSAAMVMLAEEDRLELDQITRLGTKVGGASLWKAAVRTELVDTRDMRRRRW